MIRQHPLDQGLDRAAAGLVAIQPGLDDAGVVEDQQVADSQQRGQLAKDAIDGSGGAATAPGFVANTVW